MPRPMKIALALGFERGHNTEIHERVVQLLEITRRGPGFTLHARNSFRIESAKLSGLIDAEIAPRLDRQCAAFLGGRIIEKRVGLGAKHFLG